MGVEAVSLWDLYLAEDVQRACNTWPLERFFWLMEDPRTRLTVKNMQGQPKYFDIELAGTCFDGEPASVFFTLKLPGLKAEEKEKVYEAIRRANPGASAKEKAVKKWVSNALDLPMRG